MFYGYKFNEYSLKMMRFLAIFIKDYTYFIALFSFYLPRSSNNDSTAD